MYMYMYMSMYMDTYTHTYTYVYICMYIHTHTHTRLESTHGLGNAALARRIELRHFHVAYAVAIFGGYKRRGHGIGDGNAAFQRHLQAAVPLRRAFERQHDFAAQRAARLQLLSAFEGGLVRH